MADAASDCIAADVAVVGAGPAGIAAAACAAEAGRRVVLLDAGLAPGGQIWRHRSAADLPDVARRWLERLDGSGARLICGASVVDATADVRLVADIGGVPVDVRTDALILATGARERFLPFPGWTLPGVVGVGGAQALLKSGASFDDRRVVVAGSGPLLLPVAATLAKSGARLAVVAEQAAPGALVRFGTTLWRWPGKVLEAVRYRAAFLGTRYALGTWVARADGGDRVREVTLTDGRRSWTEPCDLLCTGYGLVPNTRLARLLGCRIDRGRVEVDAFQRTSVPGAYCAGESTGIGGVDASLVEGEIAGLAVADHRAAAERRFRRRHRQHRFSTELEAAFVLRPELGDVGADTTVCRCEDVPLGRIRPEWTSRQAKLYARVGMGPCQGRVCSPGLQYLFGWTPDTVRSPIAPVSVSTLFSFSESDHDEGAL